MRKLNADGKNQKKQSDWLSFTQVRKNYNRHLNSGYFYYPKGEITKNKYNTNQLYKITAKLSWCTKG